MPYVPEAPYRVPLRSWLSAHGPFPQFRSALLDAEAYLNGFLTGTTPAAWRALHDSAGDGDALFGMLGALLAAQRLRLEMSQVQGKWVLAAVGVALIPMFIVASLLVPHHGKYDNAAIIACASALQTPPLPAVRERWHQQAASGGHECRLAPERSTLAPLLEQRISKRLF